MRRCRLHVTGASGAGTTTLGRALADAWSVPHADADDYYWLPTIPPFTQAREPAGRVPLMRELFVPRDAWVLSGSVLGWAEDVVAECDAVVLLTLEPGSRLGRLERRERAARADADAERLHAFLEWAGRYDEPHFEGRSRAGHEAWLAGLTVPVLRLDSSAPVPELVERIQAWEPRPPIR